MSTKLKLEVPRQRYGTANEPSSRPRGVDKAPGADNDTSSLTPSSSPDYSRTAVKDTGAEGVGNEGNAERSNLADNVQQTVKQRNLGKGTKPGAGLEASAVETRPLETVLEVEAPSSEASSKPPHIDTPPYVHHFDTYTLVRNLQGGGFSQPQAVTAMKAVRVLLAGNMGLAKDGLVSKSDVENETYLFRAACSELRTEIQNNRKAAAERLCTERNQLQHEVDILNQKMTQESVSLKDELRGMFDDRKMAVKMEQRSMESKIQELHYRITVALNSDARSEIEGLRWVLTRRAAFAIAISALMILATLRYSSYMAHSQEVDRKQMSSTGVQTESGKEPDGHADTDRHLANSARMEQGAPEDGLVSSVQAGNHGYVSLG